MGCKKGNHYFVKGPDGVYRCVMPGCSATG
jgi:hypothetical protein